MSEQPPQKSFEDIYRDMEKRGSDGGEQAGGTREVALSFDSKLQEIINHLETEIEAIDADDPKLEALRNRWDALLELQGKSGAELIESLKELHRNKMIFSGDYLSLAPLLGIKEEAAELNDKEIKKLRKELKKYEELKGNRTMSEDTRINELRELLKDRKTENEFGKTDKEIKRLEKKIVKAPKIRTSKDEEELKENQEKLNNLKEERDRALSKRGVETEGARKGKEREKNTFEVVKNAIESVLEVAGKYASGGIEGAKRSFFELLKKTQEEMGEDEFELEKAFDRVLMNISESVFPGIEELRKDPERRKTMRREFFEVATKENKEERNRAIDGWFNRYFPEGEIRNHLKKAVKYVADLKETRDILGKKMTREDKEKLGRQAAEAKKEVMGAWEKAGVTLGFAVTALMLAAFIALIIDLAIIEKMMNIKLPKNR